MRVEECDERDSHWESYCPRFRVYIFAGDGPGYPVSTYDITDADILDVVSWAQTRAGTEHMYAVALVCDKDDAGRGLVWLVGMDLNDVPSTESERKCQAAMRARRNHGIIVDTH